jgi:hypothetical protein
MPKLACPCGFIHDLSPIPDDGWLTVRDRDYEALIEAELAAQAGDDRGSARRVGLWGLLYECPKCRRLMWKRPGEEGFTVFRLER